MNTQNSLLAHLIAIMDGVAEYQFNHRKEGRKRKRDGQDGPRVVKKKEPIDKNETSEMVLDESTLAVADNLANSEICPSPNDAISERPTTLQHIVVGINEVTRRLECQIRRSRTIIIRTTTETSQAQSPLKIIFACRADIDPPMLVDHLPHLAAAYNSGQTKDTLKLVTLPKGAEVLLAQAMGLRRASVIGIDVCSKLDFQNPYLKSFQGRLTQSRDFHDLTKYCINVICDMACTCPTSPGTCPYPYQTD